MGHYKGWRTRVRDHLSASNQQHATLLSLVKEQNQFIQLSSMKTVKLDAVRCNDLKWVSRHLWTSLGTVIINVMLERRLELVHGEEWNGLELWRQLFRENEGGAEQV